MNSNNNVGHGNLSNKFFTLKLLVFQWLILAVICLLPFAITSKLYGQPAVVTIQEIVYLPNGQPARGSLSMRLNAFCVAPPSSSFIYGGVVNTVQLSSTGMLTVQLVPNSSCNPATSYFVTYNLTDSRGNAQPHASETWYIPDSPSTNTIRAVRTGTLPTAPLTMSISALIGMTIGDVLYGNAFGGVSRLGGNATVNRKFLSSVGNGTTPTAPSWQPIITGTPQAGCLQTPDGYSVTSTGTPCGAGGGGGGDSAVNSAGVINSAYGSLSSSYPTLGGYSGSGNFTGSLAFGDGTGKRFTFGYNNGGVFAPSLHLFDKGAINWPTGVTYTELVATSLPNGTLIYCQDCTETIPCAGGGSGAIARVLGGVKNCASGGNGTGGGTGGTGDPSVSFNSNFSANTNWTVLAADHGFGTCDIIDAVYTYSGTVRTGVEYNSYSCNTSTYDISIGWSSDIAGKLNLIKIGGTGTYAAAKTGSTWTVTGATHNLGTCELNYSTLVTSGGSLVKMKPQAFSCNTSTYDVTVTWNGTSTTGRLLLAKTVGLGYYGGSVPSGATWTITNSTHALGTCDLIPQIYTVSGSVSTITEPNSISCDSSTNTFTVNWTSAKAGRVALTKAYAGISSDSYQLLIEKNVSGGYAGLNGSGKIANTQVTKVLSLADLIDVTTVLGTGTKILRASGTFIPGNALTTDSSGNVIDSGTVPGGSGGGGGGGGGTGTPETLGLGLTRANGPLEVNTATVPTFLYFSASLDFPSISANSYADLTISVSGALTNATIIPGWPSNISSGITPYMFVSSTGVVTIRLRNNTGSPIDPADSNYAGRIILSF